jgi:FtsP/CotA-like multicopper oxidase with cupredoxin domain
VDSHFKFSIDNHTLQVIAADLVPITPYSTTVLDIGIGQRYDLIVTADQASVADNFWLRAIPQSACSDVDNADDIKGIIYYGDSLSTPETTGYDYVDSCSDETSNIVPYLSKTVGGSSETDLETASVAFNSDQLFRWYLNSTTMVAEWDNPALLQILDGVTTFDTSDAVIELPDADEWIYVVIQTTLGVPHPIHLHGHDFYILAQDSGTYSASSTTLNLSNPPRRDTAMLPSSGYLVLAFQTDNPGAWLMHCHIGWHTSEGFALQFVERYDEIAGITDADTVRSNCDAWSTFQEESGIEQEDSGV